LILDLDPQPPPGNRRRSSHAGSELRSSDRTRTPSDGFGMKLIRGALELVDGGTRRRIYLSAVGAVVLALLDMLAVLLVFPLIQLVAAPQHATDEPALGIGFGSSALFHDATFLAIAVVALFALKNLLAIVFLRWNLGFILSAETKLATRLFANQLQAASLTPGAVDTGSLLRSLNESLRRVFTEGLAFVLPAIADQLVIALLSVLVVVIAPLEAAVAVATFGLAAVGYRRFVHRGTTSASASLHTDQRLAYSIANESLRASREIALLQAQGQFVGRYDELRHRTGRAQRTISLNEQLPRSFLELCLLLCTASVAAVAFTHHSTASALALVATFAAVGFRVLPSLNRVLLASSRNRAATPSLDQIRADLDDLRDPAPVTTSGEISERVRSVDVRDLTVQVAGRATPLLQGIDLHLQPGEMVGILGASGAGKTSLVNAILGFIPAASGEVLINGDVEVSGPESWAGRAAVVPQDVVILDASLRENVAFGLRPDEIDDARVLNALSRAHLDGILAELPDGTATTLGELGARLSGGQRQRLGIARALYYDTDVLVLDESTAGLDHATEQRLLATLLELKHDRIVVVVSHHRPVMELCDRLVVLDAGHVVSTGSVDHLQEMLDATTALSVAAHGGARALPA
jgi:ABC-type multidrug transport system fused ATPase/permease subunit